MCLWSTNSRPLPLNQPKVTNERLNRAKNLTGCKSQERVLCTFGTYVQMRLFVVAQNCALRVRLGKIDCFGKMFRGKFPIKVYCGHVLGLR